MIKKHLKFAVLPALTLMAFVSFSSFQDQAVEPIVGDPGGYTCTVSSDAKKNTGFCRALSSGNGDMCFTYGSGTACSS
jgi:hypothetical protein